MFESSRNIDLLLGVQAWRKFLFDDTSSFYSVMNGKTADERLSYEYVSVGNTQLNRPIYYYEKAFFGGGGGAADEAMRGPVPMAMPMNGDMEEDEMVFDDMDMADGGAIESAASHSMDAAAP